jgi:hypothetical protein
MKRRWRIALFVVLAVALAAIPVLLYGMLDRG